MAERKTRTPQQRDGTSQKARFLNALSPDYALVDERGVRDQLRFAQKLAKEIRYFNEKNEADEDWSNFVSPPPGLSNDEYLDEIIRFMDNPDAIPQSRIAYYRRPHFVLFLTFLQLIDQARGHLNTLTRRHLDYYYKEFLQIKKKVAQPDRVHVLMDLAKNQSSQRLRSGTLLNAGKDSKGKPVIYQTERDLIVSPAKISKLHSLYIDKRIIGITEIREQKLRDSGTGVTGRSQAVVAMLKMTLGEPVGDRIKALPTLGHEGGKELENIWGRLDFIGKGLGMSFSDFLELMKLKNQREPSQENSEYSSLLTTLEADWSVINDKLEIAARKKNPNISFPDLGFSQAFNSNLKRAVGDIDYQGLPEVTNITDLYHHRNRPDASEFVETHLAMSGGDFSTMMDKKVSMDLEWKRIRSLLEASTSIPGDQKIIEFDDPPSFTHILEQWIKPRFPQSLKDQGIYDMDTLYAAMLKQERELFLTSFDLYKLIRLTRPNETPSETHWRQVEDVLASAHEKSVIRRFAIDFEERTNEFEREREPLTTLNSLLLSVLGMTDDGQTVATLLDEFSRRELITVDDVEVIEREVSNIKAVEPVDWINIFAILAIAKRNTLERTPVAQVEQWNSIHALSDARFAIVSREQGIESQSKYWSTFGSSNNEKFAELGWAISSRCFLLREGDRKITLTLRFNENELTNKIRRWAEDKKKPLFSFFASTKKGWQELSQSVEPGENLLIYELNPADNSAVIAKYPDDLVSRHWPTVKAVMNNQVLSEEGPGLRKLQYQVIRNLTLEQAKIQVTVSGIKEFDLENDTSVLNPGKPFEPFGPLPTIGSRFKVRHTEISRQNLDAVTLRGEWKDFPPEGLREHYKNYTKPSELGNSVYKARLSIVDSKLSNSLGVEESEIFSDDNEQINLNISFNNLKGSESRSAENVLGWDRYVECELSSGDFQHTSYPVLAARKTAQLAAILSNKLPAEMKPEEFKPDSYVLNQPYTPKLKSLTLGYSASTQISFGSTNTEKTHSNGDRLFHIHPFGYSLVDTSAKATVPLLPQYDNQGELYLGLENISPPQNLSLLFQVAEGTANPDLTPEPLQWHYLSGNEWLTLKQGQVLSDETNGLIQSGVIELSLNPVLANTILDPELYWLKASIHHNSKSVCSMIAIETNAVLARFVDSDNAKDHYDNPLPPDTVNKLVTPNRGIKAIRQPYTSFGGSSAEKDREYYIRVSERLRHKNRAVTAWDYERLILDQFPEIYKVKCIPASPKKPGVVRIVVIPDIRKRFPFDPFAPKVPANLIADIERYLSCLNSSFARISVINAEFIPIQVRAGVRFKHGYDAGFYQSKLTHDLNRFLSPWAFDEGEDIEIGNRVYANSIVNFIDRREYIDYVINLRLHGAGEDRRVLENTDFPQGQWIGSRVDNGVLVSSQEHQFVPVTDTGYVEESFSGIGHMKIELDFRVSENTVIESI